MAKPEFGASMGDMLEASAKSGPREKKKATKDERRKAKKAKAAKPEAVEDEGTYAESEPSPETEAATSEVVEADRAAEAAEASAESAVERAQDAMAAPDAGFTEEEKGEVAAVAAELESKKRERRGASLDSVIASVSEGYLRELKIDKEAPALSPEQTAQFQAERDAIVARAIARIAERKDVSDEHKQNFADLMESTLGTIMPDDHRGSRVYIGPDSVVNPDITALAEDRGNIAVEMYSLQYAGKGRDAKRSLVARAKEYGRKGNEMRALQAEAGEALKTMGEAGAAMRDAMDGARATLAAMEKEIRAGGVREEPNAPIETPAERRRRQRKPAAAEAAPAPEAPDTPAAPASEMTTALRRLSAVEKAPPRKPRVTRERPVVEGELLDEAPAEPQGETWEQPAEPAPAAQPAPSRREAPAWNDTDAAERARLEQLRDAFGITEARLYKQLQEEFGVGDPVTAAEKREKGNAFFRGLTDFTKKNQLLEEYIDARRQKADAQRQLQDRGGR